MTVVRRPGVRTQWLALAGSFVVLAGVLVAWAVGAAGRRVEVVQVVRPVAVGAVIEVTDLAVTAVAFDGSVDGLVPGSSLEALAGRIAAVELAAGVLVQRGMWADGPVLAAGERSVGAVLAAGRFPAGVRPGDLVDVAPLDVGVAVVDPISDGDTDATVIPTDAVDAAQVAETVTARVLAVIDLDGGAVSVTLAVPEVAAVDIARAAALDQLVVVGLPIGVSP